ncbi:Metal-dependent hydrolases of the beta-lactamase superfamily I [hydrothermal vent metagenome]|uniref:Metal-dependent hydrolases of the beta-lactamase superfamily I n=1 Tax=hydrothermal vent metagenome TaxID=652676 RepID=A0A3B1BXN4_9ZZZZ
MRFASLGSGSRGNATLIEAGGTRLLVDCGFSAKETEKRLGELNVAADTLDAILVTHEHGDHIRGVGVMARRYRIPVWMTGGTLHSHRCGELPDSRSFTSHQAAFMIGAIQVTPFPVPHDARETVQFTFSSDGAKFGMLTDSGAVTPHVVELLQDCDALMLECNHDVKMLAFGPYPSVLQARVGGRLGHLNNRQAADLLRRVDHGRLRHLVAAHLSEKNNTPELVKEALLEVSHTIEERMVISGQDKTTGWLEV